MDKKFVSNLSIEGAKIIMSRQFRNFSGREMKFNPAGRRSFSIYIDPELAQQLAEDGWKIRYLTARDEDSEDVPFLQVRVNYDSQMPPKIWLVTKTNKTLLDEDSVQVLDYAEIESADIVISPYAWTMNDGKSGITAYVKSMYVTIKEDDFDSKYADISEGGFDKSAMDEVPFN